MRAFILIRSAAFASATAAALGGEFSGAMNDPTNPYDAPIPGFVGPHGIGKARFEYLDEEYNPVVENPGNYVNPLFFGWASGVVDYQPSDFVTTAQANPEQALGPVSGEHVYGVVSLGDLDQNTISTDAPGTITLEFQRPVRNLSGADFVLFENAYRSNADYGGAGIGGVFAELGYVEVSANGVDFVRFPATSLTAQPLNIYASIDPTGVRNLVGKHVNAYGDSWGTPFDLDDVGLSRVTHVRIVDIPGEGRFLDQHGNPVYDPWYPLFTGTPSGTFDTGGVDLDAVGVISTGMNFDDWPQLEMLPVSQRGEDDDPDLDGMSNLVEYAFGLLPWAADASSGGVTLVMSPSGNPEVSFPRDERTEDLVVELQVSSSMAAGGWTTLASSVAGAAMAGGAGASLEIGDVSSSAIASVGVLRRVTVKDLAPPQDRGFYRVKVTRSPSPALYP